MNRQEVEKQPLLKYVTILEKIPRGGTVRFTCNYCRKEIVGSYPRVKAHLLKLSGSGTGKCSKVTPEHVMEMEKVVEDFEARKLVSRPKTISLPPTTSRTLSSSASTAYSKLNAFDVLQSNKKRGASSGGALEKAFNLEARQELDAEIAKMFYSVALSFNLARNPHYISAFTKAANSKNLSGYVPPGYNALRTTLLLKERSHIERLLEPLKTTWVEKGVSIVSDGWTDAQRRPLINFMAACESGPMFLKAVNCEGAYKDKFFIANLLKEVIEKVGLQNVVQVITNNAPVFRAAGLLVEAQYSHVFWVPCVVHTLNLALKNICKATNTEANVETYLECNWITEIIGDVMVMKNFVMLHSMRLSMFNAHSSLKMLSVAETRFVSSLIMLKRFKRIKQSLLNMVVSPDWMNYREDDVAKVAHFKEKVLDDLWWDKIDYILSFTEPIYDMLRKADTDKPSLHLGYDWWDTMIEKVKIAIYRHEGLQDHEDSSFYYVVHKILVERWSKSNTPLHYLAHSLNPRYYSVEWLRECPTRVAPHKDDEISHERLKFFERFFPDVNMRRQANTKFAKFSASLREFANSDSISDRGYMEPDLWWVTHGSSTPLLQSLALKLLGQPCSSSCCERNWSTYSFINSLKRNKITPQRGEDLVFVHSNLRLLSRHSPQYTQGETNMWDIGGDAFDSMENIGVLEVASLSLDEPEMEATLLDGERVEDGSDQADEDDDDVV